MPWIAEHNGDPVTPQDVSTREVIFCPRCGDEMHVRGPYTRSDGSFVARHFSHNPSDVTPPGNSRARSCRGESDEHKRMKSIAYSKLKHIFGDLIDSIEIESQADASGKTADVEVVFSQHIDEHPAIVSAEGIDGAVGDRIAVEAQYRNESKDIQGTARRYAEHGYTVLWLYPEQYSKYDVELFAGSGAQWSPVYPAVTRLDIDFPGGWDHHEQHLPTTRSVGTVNATFPVKWFEDDLKKQIALNGDDTQYERWSRLFPEVAEEFIELAEEMLRDPSRKGELLLDTLYPTLDPTVTTNFYGDDSVPRSEAVCGNCYWHDNDEFRDDDNAIICWRNQPDGSGNQPRKLTLNDEFAQECQYFNFSAYENERMIERMDIHPSLTRPWLLKALAGAKGVSRRERRKAALKFAYYQTWGREEWNSVMFSPAREEGFLRHLDSPLAVPHQSGCASTGGVVLPFDNCSACGRERQELSSDEELLVDVAVGDEVQDWVCSSCEERGRGMS